jgi:hypothetical protein
MELGLSRKGENINKKNQKEKIKDHLLLISCSDLPCPQLERIRNAIRDTAPNAATDKLFPLPRPDALEVLGLLGRGVATD